MSFLWNVGITELEVCDVGVGAEDEKQQEGKRSVSSGLMGRMSTERQNGWLNHARLEEVTMNTMIRVQYLH